MVVGGVMGSSAAEDVGLEVGDVLLAYDGRSIFSGSELQRQTARGDSGALVAVDVGRNGESLRFYLPRGPIGIRLKAEKRTPTAVR